ncbi:MULTISPECIES: helix-turn-helix domain-containing protein [Clostridium]|uniref:helix-turn-helix domain-containing protein n=1 Tax=Clostridium TaxID=1485 RepID=UPI000C06EFB9|nr:MULTISPECIES: helix-turn-helix domain-containing protein [Clostridium]MDU4728007.1 helix-turn-helix domain-containing protein [Clostridium sp.]
MLSSFGKFTRKLRIERSQLLKEMAELLNVTTSYLSAVEMGKRNVPESWREIIIANYKLDNNEVQAMDEAIYNSQRTLKLNLNSYDEDDKNLILSFARKFDELEVEEKDNLRRLLSK